MHPKRDNFKGISNYDVYMLEPFSAQKELILFDYVIL